jgi:hypothetical protein
MKAQSSLSFHRSSRTYQLYNMEHRHSAETAQQQDLIPGWQARNDPHDPDLMLHRSHTLHTLSADLHLLQRSVRTDHITLKDEETLHAELRNSFSLFRSKVHALPEERPTRIPNLHMERRMETHALTEAKLVQLIEKGDRRQSRQEGAEQYLQQAVPPHVDNVTALLHSAFHMRADGTVHLAFGPEKQLHVLKPVSPATLQHPSSPKEKGVETAQRRSPLELSAELADLLVCFPTSSTLDGHGEALEPGGSYRKLHSRCHTALLRALGKDPQLVASAEHLLRIRLLQIQQEVQQLAKAVKISSWSTECTATTDRPTVTRWSDGQLLSVLVGISQADSSVSSQPQKQITQQSAIAAVVVLQGWMNISLPLLHSAYGLRQQAFAARAKSSCAQIAYQQLDLEVHALRNTYSTFLQSSLGGSVPPDTLMQSLAETIPHFEELLEKHEGVTHRAHAERDSLLFIRHQTMLALTANVHKRKTGGFANADTWSQDSGDCSWCEKVLSIVDSEWGLAMEREEMWKRAYAEQDRIVQSRWNTLTLTQQHQLVAAAHQSTLHQRLDTTHLTNEAEERKARVERTKYFLAQHVS